MGQMHIGLIGLGRMGCGLGGRLGRAGIRVSGHDRSENARRQAAESGIDSVDSVDSLVAMLDAPRLVWVMVPAGEPVDMALGKLAGLLEEGDSIVEGGNSDYRDSMRRHTDLAARGIGMLDVGTSGGILGPEAGYSLMVGGRSEEVKRWRPVFEAAAPAPDRGWAHVGPSGAGHFAKMVHNAIEYGLMQAYAEGVALLHSEGAPAVDAARAAEAWRDGSIISSTLMDLTAAILADGQLDRIRPYVDDSGLGRLAVQTAIDRGVAAPVITQSLIERIKSRDGSGLAARVLSAMRGRFGGHPVPEIGSDGT